MPQIAQICADLSDLRLIPFISVASWDLSCQVIHFVSWKFPSPLDPSDHTRSPLVPAGWLHRKAGRNRRSPRDFSPDQGEGSGPSDQRFLMITLRGRRNRFQVLNVVEGTGTNYLGLFVSLGTKGRKPKDRFMWFPRPGLAIW
ncbi:MAG: hypothetical protein QNK37_13725 [Acidobacteriota bacterium]|nr:hypothetical protein [Acidobacteriota bacterium]